MVSWESHKEALSISFLGTYSEDLLFPLCLYSNITSRWSLATQTEIVIQLSSFLLILFFSFFSLGFSGSSAGKESACNLGDLGLIPGLGKIPWRREWLPTPVFWTGEFHRLYSPRSRKELDTTKLLSLFFFISSDHKFTIYFTYLTVAAAAAKSLPLCLTLCDPRGGYR